MNAVSGLNDAAAIALRDVVGLRGGEEVLILTNPEDTVFTIARALFEEARALGGKPVILLQEKKLTATCAERLVLEIVRAEPDILVTLTKARAGKDPHGLQIGYTGRDGRRFDHIVDKVTKGDRRVRGFSSPNANPGLFARCVPLDYGALRRRAAALKGLLDDGETVRVTAPGGTDISFSVAGRRAHANTGDYRRPGHFGNLPAGEVYISPAPGSGTGTIAFDGTLSTLEGPVIPAVPVVISFRDGFVEHIHDGPLADRVRRTIEEGEAMARAVGNDEECRNCRHLGEFGIGINDKAQITGVILEDEKALKTCHFALGSNYDFDAPAIIHRDMLVMNPSVWVDDVPVMKKGHLIL
ncbi:MAG: Thermophilic metalloprotease (M29) [Methanocella sp. PtaU1.Bin125]|nr:MAG: Thermophilic metalloprotease (M29) [Methanocella sp. PtaU1.Bin125]